MDYQILSLVVLLGHCLNFQLDFSESTIVFQLSCQNCLGDYNEKCCSSFACFKNDSKIPSHCAGYVCCCFESKIQLLDDLFWIDSCFSVSCLTCYSWQSFARQTFQFWTERSHRRTSRRCGRPTACSAAECSLSPSHRLPPHLKAHDSE